MNYTRAIFLISDNVRVVAVTYEADENADWTLYKTFDTTLKVGDFVTVPTKTRHKMTVCKVVAVDCEQDFEAESDIDWIIGVVDRANFQEIERQEQEAIAKIKAAEKRRRRAELRESLLADTATEILALPIAQKKES